MQDQVSVVYDSLLHCTAEHSRTGKKLETDANKGFGGTDTTKYGWMNFFCWMNIQDYEATFSFKPTRKAKIAAEYHFFRLDEAKDAWYWSSGRPARQDATGKAGSNVGQELDLVLTYDFSKRLKAMVGYCHFFPGPFLRSTGASPGADWFFVQTLYTF